MKYTIALIGCGRISFKHIEGLIRNADTLELVAVCDVVAEKAQQKLAEFIEKCEESNVTVDATTISAYTDYKQMLKVCKPNIVTITTESGNHKDITVECLNSGCHVICEKPMALSTNDAQAMIDASEANKKKLAISFQNRFNAPIQKLRTAVEQNRFSRILHGMVQVRWNRNDDYYAAAPWRGTWAEDGGTLMNQCTHGIDLLQWMMGEKPVRVQAQTRRFMRPIEAEDFGCAIIEFENGSVGIVEGSAVVQPKNLSETLSIFGEKGTAVIGGLAVNKIETWRFDDAHEVGDTEETVVNPDEVDPPNVYGFGHSALFADMVDAIKNDREPLASGKRSKIALDIILAIYESQKTGKAVDLPNNFATTQMTGEFEK